MRRRAGLALAPSLGITVLGITVLGLMGCGPSLTAPTSPSGATRSVEGDGLDYGRLGALPAEVDVVVRVDLARLRATLGPEIYGRLEHEVSADPVVSFGVRHARVVELGLSLRHLEAGGRLARFVDIADQAGELELEAFTRVKIADGSIAVHERQGLLDVEAVALVARDKRSMLLAWPALADSAIAHLEGRGVPTTLQPGARSVIAFALRAEPFSPKQAKRFPAIARLWAGVESLRGRVEPEDDGLTLRVDLEAKSAKDAERAQAFVETLKSGAKETGPTRILKQLSTDRVEHTVFVRWPLPPGVILEWLDKAPRPGAEGKAASDE